MNKIIAIILFLSSASAMAQQTNSTESFRIVESNWWSEVETTLVQGNHQNAEIEILEHPLVHREKEQVIEEVIFKESEPVKIEPLKKPFFIIGYAAVNTKSAAIKIVERLKKNDYAADYFWIPDYEPGGKELYRIYVGPFKTQDETQMELIRVKRIQPTAYIKLIK